MKRATSGKLEVVLSGHLQITSSVSWKKSSSELRHIQLSLHLDHISQVLKLKNILHDMGEQIQVIQKLINATRSGLIECDQVRIQCH